MLLRKHAMPIFLLYIITSTIFLVIFSVMFFIYAKNSLATHTRSDLNLAKKEIEFALKNGAINEIKDMEFDDIKARITEIKSGQILIDKIKNHTDIAMGFSKIDGEIYLKSIFHTKKRANVYEIILKSDDFREEISELAVKFIAFTTLVMIILLVISYFIIRLSFRPLFDKINSLNSFITDATHEINTPLSVILMSIEMFKTNPKKYLNNIKIASLTLSGVYESLVSLNLKSSPNKFQIISVKSLIEERIQFFSVILAKKNLQISANLEDITLDTDKFKLEKIFDNILSNAIKYCDENSVISINLNGKSLSIQNFGKTIPGANQMKIYEKFTRFDKEKGGFGIGLSIVKKFADELNFKISLKSENSSTTFTLWF